MKSSYLLCVIALLMGCAQPSPSHPQSSQQDSPESSTDQRAPERLTEFRPDVDLQNQLGEPFEIAEYRISPPSGYVMVEVPVPAGSNLVGWAGQRRPDGSAPMVQVLIITPPENETLPVLDQAMKKLIAHIERRRKDWTESETSYGLIDGIKFAKRTWSGTETITGNKMVGIMYVGIRGRSIIQLHTQDLETHLDALELGETALLTLSKK
jgi:hypothetical protein